MFVFPAWLRFGAVAGLVVLAFGATSATADDAPRVDAPTQGSASPRVEDDEVHVRVLTLHYGSRYGEMLSPVDAFPSALPGSVSGRRKSGVATTPGFGTLVTFEGADVDSFDFLLEYPLGKRVASYPVGQTRSERELWQAASLAAEPDDRSRLRVARESWVSKLREADRLWFGSGRRTEAGLMVDLAQKATVDVRLKREGDAWFIGNLAKQSVGRTGVFVPSETNQVQLAILDSVSSDDVGDDNTPGDAAEEDGEKPPVIDKSTQVAGQALIAMAASALGGSKPKVMQALPKTPPRSDAAFQGTPLELSSPLTVSAAVEQYLAAYDDLGDFERDYLTEAIGATMLQERAIVVYELTPRDRERLRTVEITPRIGPISEHVWVVAVDLDPRLAEKIDQYITDLGDESWAKRREADAALRGLGRAAIAGLERAKDASDPEVAMRARRIVADFKKQP